MKIYEIKSRHTFFLLSTTGGPFGRQKLWETFKRPCKVDGTGAGSGGGGPGLGLLCIPFAFRY